MRRSILPVFLFATMTCAIASAQVLHRHTADAAAAGSAAGAGLRLRSSLAQPLTGNTPRPAGGLLRAGFLFAPLAQVSTGVAVPWLADGLSLAAYPNPFRAATGATRISYRLPVAGTVLLRVSDLIGRTVAELPVGEQTAGDHEVRFAPGSTVPAGVYVAFLTVHSAAGARTAQTLIQYSH